MTPIQVEQLIDDLLDQSITEADFIRLEAELQLNPDARQVYYERLKLHNALEVEVKALPAPPRAVTASTRHAQARWLLRAAAAILLLVTGILGWWIGQGAQPARPTDVLSDAEPLASGYAVVAEQSAAVWENQPALSRGDILPQEPVKLKSGLVKLDLFSGVTLIVEGEAEFEVLSPMEVFVRAGRVRALVPEPAIGFRVRTATGDVVDLGTEFAVDVTADHADLHVLKGEIEWHAEAKPVKRLKRGQSMRWTAQGESITLDQRPDSFLGDDELQRRWAEERVSRRESWLRRTDQIRADPRLLVYYQMGHDGQADRLTDLSGSGHHGTVVREHRVPDRWGQPSSALDFSAPGTGTRLYVAGEHGSLTFMCWVRIDSLDRRHNSLFLTDGYDLNEAHWQLLDDGRLTFSVKASESKDGPRKQAIHSQVIWTPSMSGNWLQLATVFDIDTGMVTHYVNGRVNHSERIVESLRVAKVQIGAASIGNWNDPTRQSARFPVRNLNGAIDEFAIFSAALTADEVRELYEAGKP